MPLCKILKDYENVDGWSAGQTVEITNPWTLIREGKAVLVDEAGNELPVPGTKFTCPFCYHEADSVSVYVDHIDTHKSKPTVEAKTETVAGTTPAGSVPTETEGTPTAVDPVVARMEAIRTKRLANLARARLTRKEAQA